VVQGKLQFAWPQFGSNLSLSANLGEIEGHVFQLPASRTSDVIFSLLENLPVHQTITVPFYVLV